MKTVIWSGSLPLRIALCTLLLLSRTSPAQSHRPSAAGSNPAAQQIAELLLSQQRALQTGDPATIAEATRPLAARLLREMAELRLLTGKPGEGIELYHSSLQLQDSTEVRLELAAALIRTGNPKEAADESAVVLQADPRSASAWTIRGTALQDAGLHTQAADAFSHSLEIRQSLNTAYALGSALLAGREKEKADRIFQQIITGSGNAAIWHAAVGDAYRQALYLTDAVEEFKKAIAIDPRVGHAEFFLGLTYLQINQWGPSPQSFEHLRAAVRLAPHEYLSNFYLGALESTAGSDIASSNRHLRAATEADPSSPEAWLYLGLNAVRNRDTVEAKIDLRKAIDLTGPNEDRNNYQIRRAYALLGRILIGEGNHVEGDALLARYKQAQQKSLANSANSIADSANDDLAHSAQTGVIAARASFPGMSSATPLAADEPASASTLTPVAPKQTPGEERQIAATEHKLGDLLASSFNDLGTAEARQGQYALALGHFQQAERWQPPTPVLLRNLGTAAFRSGDFKESARALGLYLRAGQSPAPNSAHDDRSQMMLAMSLFSMGKFPDADKAFAPISAQTLQDPRAAYSWAYSLAHSGQQQHANQIAGDLTRQELPPDVLSLVCHLYMDTEDYEQSVACFRKAYQADPNLKLAHYQVAESLIRLDRPAEAVPELREELTLNPDNPDVQYSLAFALLQSSHKEEAMTILENLTASHPNHAQAQYQLGKALLEAGKTADAVTHLELAERNDPAPDYIHYQLQAAYRKAGRIEDADRELQVYREIKSRNREITSPHE